MTPELEQFHMANFAHYLEVYDRGSTADERTGDIARLMLQNKGQEHYDRDQGGSLEELEQEPKDESLFQRFRMNAVESIFRLNDSKENDPFIVVGVRDITVDTQKKTGVKTIGQFIVRITHRPIDNLKQANRLSLVS